MLIIISASEVLAQRSILIATDISEQLEFHQNENGIFICGNSEIQTLNQKYKCVYAKKLKQNYPFNNLDLFSLKFNTEASTFEVLVDFNNLDIIYVAEDNSPKSNEEILGNSMMKVPNDPMYPQQLGPAYMYFPDAWEITTGSHNVKVAIFDTGLDWYHPDLLDNIYVNSGEINENTVIDWNNGIIYGDGLDNDGNGYVDDLVGWDFASDDNNPIHPIGGHAHGTQVSGPLCAVGNNNQHVCGMAWNASVMGMRLEGDWLGNSIEAIDYCITQHFDVINMSYGADWLNQTLFHDKIKQAYYDHNISFISIAQNYNLSYPIYPGAWPEVFAMGAVDQYDQKANYSNYGSWVDAVTVNYQHGMLGYADGQHWSMIWDGATSTSAPLTSGLTILIKSLYHEWSSDKIFNQILITTDNIDQVNPNYVGLLGTGRINALRALTFNGVINENLIWSKTLKIFHNISVNAGKTLTLRAGTNLLFQPGKTFDVYGNLVVEGDLTINQNIIIQSSGNIEIAPGSNINFSNGSSLIINGTLTANGTYSNKVTFDFIEQNSTTSNGINVNFGGAISLSNAIVKNAYKGIKITLGGQPSSIQNSIIQYCRDGIFIQYGNKDADLTVEYCEIKNNLNYGICIFNKAGYGMNSEPVISNNNIESCNYGVYLNGNVGAVIQRNQIENCTQGIYVYEGQPSIMRNTILNPLQNGIYCNAPGKRPLILDNTIQKESHINSYHNYQGIWIENNTAAYIAHNDISGFYWGIYCGGGVNSYLSDYEFNDFYPNNRMRDNLFGFAAGWGSYIYAGKGIGDGCWNSSIYENVYYDVKSYQYSYVMAQYNYWGGGRPNAYVDGTSELYADEILERDPWGENKLLAGSSNNPISIKGGNSDIVKGLFLRKMDR